MNSNKKIIMALLLIVLLFSGINVTLQNNGENFIRGNLENLKISCFINNAFASYMSCWSCGGNWWAGCPELWMICCYGGYVNYGGACWDTCTMDAPVWEEKPDPFKMMCI